MATVAEIEREIDYRIQLSGRHLPGDPDSREHHRRRINFEQAIEAEYEANPPSLPRLRSWR
jgi:hypothetical protein